MSLVADIRGASGNLVEQLADRFDDLPRPLLAAIGAGDFAIEHISVLRPGVPEHFSGGRAANGNEEFGEIHSLTVDLQTLAQQTAADLAARTQRVAHDITAKAQQATGVPKQAQHIAGGFFDAVQDFVGQLPGKAQEILVIVPNKASEITGGLSVDTVRDTVGAYFELAGTVYGHLADRGEATWSRVRLSAPQPGTVVDALVTEPTTTAPTTTVPATTTTPAKAAKTARANPVAAKTARTARSTKATGHSTSRSTNGKSVGVEDTPRARSAAAKPKTDPTSSG